MATPISKHQGMSEVQLRGMIQHAQREYPFLDHSSSDALYALARLMIDVDFMVDRKVTPLRSSLEFLRRIGEQAPVPIIKIHERDFVFLIKMFGLMVRDKHGLLEFLPKNRWIDDHEADGKPAVEVKIDTESTARKIELEISDVKKHRKIHDRRIEAGTNRLLRWYRDVQLAVLLAEQVKNGAKIGEARETLRLHYHVKDHEYVRIRERALEMGLMDATRTAHRKNTRVTLDPDVAAFVDKLSVRDGRMHAKTPTQTVNQAMRDLHMLLYKAPLPAIPKDDAAEDDDLSAADTAVATQSTVKTPNVRTAAKQPVGRKITAKKHAKA